jgi:hypothetical protein
MLRANHFLETNVLDPLRLSQRKLVKAERRSDVEDFGDCVLQDVTWACQTAIKALSHFDKASNGLYFARVNGSNYASMHRTSSAVDKRDIHGSIFSTSDIETSEVATTEAGSDLDEDDEENSIRQPEVTREAFEKLIIRNLKTKLQTEWNRPNLHFMQEKSHSRSLSVNYSDQDHCNDPPSQFSDSNPEGTRFRLSSNQEVSVAEEADVESTHSSTEKREDFVNLEIPFAQRFDSDISSLSSGSARKYCASDASASIGFASSRSASIAFEDISHITSRSRGSYESQLCNRDI